MRSFPAFKSSNPELLEIYGRVTLTGESRKFETYVEELKIWFSISVYSIEKGYFVAVFDNITERKETNDALQKAEEKYRTIFSKSIEGIFQSTADGKFITVNPALAHMWGYDLPEELISSVQNIAGQVYVDVRRRDEFARLIQEDGQVYGFEYEVRRKDGKTIWVSENARAVRDAAGTLLYYEGQIEDITKRKKADQTIRESEARYRGLFEDSPISLWEQDFSAIKLRLDTLKQQGIRDLRSYMATHPEFVIECLRLVKVTNVNTATLEVFHAQQKEEILNKLDLFLGVEARIHFVNELVDIAEGKTKFSWEGMNNTLDGGQIYISLSWSAVPGYENTLSRVIVSIVDITQRKQAEEALRQAEEKYRNIFKNAIEAITQTTPEGKYITVNPATTRMLGYNSPEELITSVTNIEHQFYVKPDRREEFISLMEKHGSITGFESEIHCKDGNTIWISENSHAIRDENGTLLYYEGTAVDITERKRAEEAQHQAEEKYRNIFKNAMEGIFQSTTEGKFITANSALAHMLGYDSPEELIASVNDINRGFYVQPARRAEFMQRLSDHGQLFNFESEVYRKGGNTIWISENAQEVFGDAGQMLYYEGTLIDITERKQAEERLNKAEEKYRNIFQNAMEAITQTTPDGKVPRRKPGCPAYPRIQF